MKTWQKYWLIAAFLFFTIHLVRDILQDLGIHNLLSDSFIKQDFSKTPGWYWKVFNTYVMEISGLMLGSYCTIKRKFGSPGYLTIFIALFFLLVWSFYWLFL